MCSNKSTIVRSVCRNSLAAGKKSCFYKKITVTYVVVFIKTYSPLYSIETVEDMIKMGVYVNDLNLHDSSRELILAGTQQSAELQLALDQVYMSH